MLDHLSISLVVLMREIGVFGVIINVLIFFRRGRGRGYALSTFFFFCLGGPTVAGSYCLANDLNDCSALFVVLFSVAAYGCLDD